MTKDKIHHALVNYAIVVGIALLWCVRYAIAFAIIISIGKEIYDTYKRNATGFNLKDLIADGVGITLGLLTYLIVKLLW